MKPAAFTLERPETVEEALSLLARHGDDAKVLAGGQSLVALLNLRMARPEVVVDINRLGDLAGSLVEDGVVRVGALTRQRRLERSPGAVAACPLLGQALPHVGHVATRNRGTVGGTIAHADPSSELCLLLATLGGSVIAERSTGEREIAADDLFVSHLQSSLEADELITEVRFPVLGEGWRTAFLEIAPRHGDYALCAVACALRAEGGRVREVRLGAGAVADRPVRLHAAESALLAGEQPRAVGEIARGELPDRDDHRHALAGALVERALEAALG